MTYILRVFRWLSMFAAGALAALVGMYIREYLRGR